MGNVLFDKHMSIRRDAAMHDLWSPVALTAEARIVAARAATYGGVSESIDVIAVYPQVMFWWRHQALHDNSRVFEDVCCHQKRKRCSTNCNVVCVSAKEL